MTLVGKLVSIILGNPLSPPGPAKKPNIICVLSLGLLLGLAPTVLVASPNAYDIEEPRHVRPKIAIIIDDLGYRLKEGQQSVNLPFPLTLAIIPASPHAVTLAEAANCREGKEVLVHLPMTPIRKINWEVGLSPKLQEMEFYALARKLLNSVPHAVGANNHGGSLLTQDSVRMDWLMDVLDEKALFVSKRGKRISTSTA